MLRKSLAFVLVLVFLVFSILATIFFGFYRTIFNYDFYEGPLLNNVYSNGMPILVEEVISKNKNVIGKYFTNDELLEIAKKDVPVTAFKPIVKDISSQINGILNGSDRSKIIIKLDLLKPYFDVFTDDVSNKFADKKILIKQILDKSFDENKLSNVEIDAVPVLQNFATIQNFSLLAQSFFLFLVILCFLILFILWKPFSRGLKWLGVMFFIVSFNAFVVYKMSSILLSYINIKNFGFPEKYLPEVEDIISFAVHSFMDQMLIAFAFALTLGFVLYFTGHMKSKNYK